MLRNVKLNSSSRFLKMAQTMMHNVHSMSNFVRPVNYIQISCARYKHMVSLYGPHSGNNVSEHGNRTENANVPTNDREGQEHTGGAIAFMKVTKITSANGVYEQKEMKAMKLYPAQTPFSSQPHTFAEKPVRQHSVTQLAVVPSSTSRMGMHQFPEDSFESLVANHFIPGQRNPWHGCPQPQISVQQRVGSQHQMRPPYYENIQRKSDFAPRNLVYNHPNYDNGRERYCAPIHLPYVHEGPCWEKYNVPKPQPYQHPLRPERWCH